MLQALLVDRFQLSFIVKPKRHNIPSGKSGKPLKMRASGTDVERAKAAGDSNFSGMSDSPADDGLFSTPR